MNQTNNTSGISLIEIIVAIAIIATLSVSSFAGFGYLGDILRAKETVGILRDTVKQEELKVLRGDFTSSTIHFLKDYMVIEEDIEGSSLGLSFDGECRNGHQIKSDTDASLIKKDQDGKNLGVAGIVKGGGECVKFNDAEETAWSYQLTSPDKFSDIIRFVHFNINRESKTNPITITDGVEAKIEIKAPYGKKYVYDKGGSLAEKGQVTIKMEDNNKNLQESFTLQ